MKEKPKYGKIIWITVLILFVILLIYMAFAGTGSYGEKIDIRTFENMIDSDEVTDVYYYNGIYRIRKKNSQIQEENFPTYPDYYCEVATRASKRIVSINNNAISKSCNNFNNWIFPITCNS